MPGPAEIVELALELAAAEAAGTPVPRPTQRFPSLTWDDAREIARARDGLRREDGDTHVGFKLGWTSAAMRDTLGIDRPNWGTLWSSQLATGRLGTDRLRHAKIEPEVVYTAGLDLEGPNITANDVRAAAAGWALGIEVVHPRYASYEFTWLDNTADNSSAAAFVLGPSTGAELDPASVELTFSAGGATRVGRGDQAMGSPAEAVAWLVRSLAAENETLRAGQIVFSGGLTAPFDVEPGLRYRAEAPGLGTVELRS